jgi:putative flippase GtrA
MLATALQSKTVRFFVVGIGAAGLLFLLNAFFVWMGMEPFISGVVAYAIAFVCAYSAHHAWTFSGARSHGQAFPRYLATQAICALIAGLVSHVSVTSLGAPIAVMSFLATVIGSASSYVLTRYWAFAERD